MKQIIQNYKTDILKIEEVPVPLPKKEGALIRISFSLVIAEMESETIEISKKNLLGKAKVRPNLLKQVVATSKKIGTKNAFGLIRNYLNSNVLWATASATSWKESQMLFAESMWAMRSPVWIQGMPAMPNWCLFHRT